MDKELVLAISIAPHGQRFTKERSEYKTDKTFSEALFLRVIELEKKLNRISTYASSILSCSDVSPAERVSEQQFRDLMKGYDPYYMYSDDHSVYTSGERRMSEIGAALKAQPELEEIFRELTEKKESVA